MDDASFERLLREAGKYARGKPDIFGVGAISAQRKLRRILDILEAGCTQEQWMKVLAAIEEGWP